MAESIGSALLELGVQKTGFDRGMKAAEDQAKRLDRTFDQTTKGLAAGFERVAKSVQTDLMGALKGLAAGFAVSGLVRGLGQLVTTVANTGDELNKMSIQTGIAVENLSALKVAAELNDVSLQDLSQSLSLMQVNVAQAARGAGEAAPILKQMGFSVDAMRKAASDPEGFLEQFAVQLNRIPEIGTKMEVVRAVFGRSGREMLALLQDIGQRGLKGVREEAERLGVVWSAENAAKMDEFNDNLTRLKFAALGLAQALIPLINGLNDLAVTFGLVKQTPQQAQLMQLDTTIKRLQTTREQILRGEGISRGGGFSWWNLLGAPDPEQGAQQLRDIDAQLQQLEQQRDTMTKAMQPPAQPALKIRIPTEADKKAVSDAEAAAKRLADIWKDLERGRTVIATMRETLGEAFEAPAKTVELLESTIKRLIGEGVDPGSAAVRKLRDELAQLAPEVEKNKRAQELLKQILQDTLTVSEQYRREVEAVQSLLGKGLNAEQVQRHVENLNNWLYENDAAFAGAREEAERYEQMLRDLRGPQEEYTKALITAATAFQQGKISADEYGEAVRQAAAKLGMPPGLKDEVKDTSNLARELGLTFSSAFEDAIVQGNSFRDVLKGLEQDILRLMTRKLITEPLIESLEKGLKGEGSLGRVINWFKGLMTRGTPATAATAEEAAPAVEALGRGGIITRPTLAWIGERGPEMVIPLQAGGIFGGYGAVGGMVGAQAGSMLADALFGTPEERQRDFERAMEAYRAAFAQTTGPLGRVRIGGVEASQTVDWASVVEGARGYLPTPELEPTSMLEELGRFALQAGSMLAGSRLGKGIGAALTPDVFAQAGMERPASTWLRQQGVTDIPQNTAWQRFLEGVQGLQRGGLVPGRTMALLGEAGPEAVVPLPDGRTIPVMLNDQGRPGAGTNIYMTVNAADASSFRASQDQIAAQMALRLQRAQARSL